MAVIGDLLKHCINVTMFGFDIFTYFKVEYLKD